MSTNASNINFSLLLTKFLQLLNLISLQPPRSTRSSSVVTLSRPPTISSLKITDRSFRYASPRLWDQLPDAFRQPHHSCLDSPPHPLINSSLSSSITPSLFHSRLKTYLFNKSTVDFFYLLDCLTVTGLDRTYHAHNFVFSFTFYFFLFIPCGRLSWLPVSFLLHVKYTLSYRIASYVDPDNVITNFTYRRVQCSPTTVQKKKEKNVESC